MVGLLQNLHSDQENGYKTIFNLIFFSWYPGTPIAFTPNTYQDNWHYYKQAHKFLQVEENMKC